MIDIHSHIIPNVDDGSRSMEETINMLNEAYNVGFTTVVSTSHYYLRHYEPNEAERMECLEKINTNIKNALPNLQICIGSEIYVTNEMVNLIKEHKASTINNTSYILFELPFEHQIANLKDIIYNLLGNKYIPIIAHPERYKYIQKDPNILLELIDLGVLFQSNYGSILGIYGKAPKKTVKVLLQNNFIHFLGSDTHRQKTIYPEIPNAIEELSKIISEKKLEELTTINPKLVLENQKIKIQKPIKIKKGIFGY